MKIKFPVFLAFQLLVNYYNICAQNSSCAIITFQKIFGKQNTNDLVWDIIETPDHGFITGGWRGDINDYCTLIKIDNKGDIVWSKQLSGNNTPVGFMKRFIRLKDGNYVAAGRAYSPDFLDTWLIKFDENGNIIWNKEITYPTGISTDPLNIFETTDAGLVITANYGPYANAGGSMIAKLDANGNLIWSKVCLSIYTPGLMERNGILFIVGEDYGDFSGIIIKMKSSDGSFLEGHSFKIDDKYTLFHSIEEKNNKFYIDAYNRDTQYDSLKQVVLILDNNLDVLKVHKFNFGFRHAWEIPAMFPVADDGFIAANNDENNPDLLLFKVSYDGIIKWKRQYPRPGAQVTFNIKLTSDNGIIGVGTSNDFGGYYTSPNHIFIYKTDSEGLTDCVVTDPYAVIYSPPFTKNPVSFSYNSITFPVIPINSLNNPIVVPVGSFCEKVILPACTSLKISGKDSVCNLPDTVIYKAVRNTNCNAAIMWNLDTAFAKILSSTDSTVTIKFRKEGITKLISSIENPCETISDSLSIHIFNSPGVVNLGSDIPLCENNTYTLHAGSGFKNYLWQDGSVDSVFVAHSPGQYYVSATNYCNKVFNDTANISLAPVPANFLPKDTSICEGELTTISSLLDFSAYLWSTGKTTRQVNVTSTGTYWLRVMSSDGCFAKEDINIKSKDNCTLALYFPNAFTPNNDGLNDQFRGTAFGFLKKFHLTIYNRYGNMVFETYDITTGWDGKLKAAEQQTDSFVWFSEYQFNNSPPQTMKGIITLIR